MATAESEDPPVLHVVVVGFHHKKGCQVEYSYPPLVDGQPVDSNEVPPEWKHLPSLALPDGAHNYTQDTVFFHLPSRTSNFTVYGVSCYRQMDASDLVNRGADVTRNSVQKSVCVLSRLPLYGLIQAKLELITHAYFDEKDFSRTSLLHDTYTNMNASLTQSLLLQGSQVFLGLSCREIIQQLKGKALVLFKLMMLERRVLFFSSPVQPICTTLLSIISLFPDMVEHGLNESARYLPSNSISPTLHKARSGSTSSEDFLEVRYTSQISHDSERSCQLPKDLDADVFASGDSNTPNTIHHSSPDKTNIVDDIVKQSNMEKLLETEDDDGLTFKEDKLLLEIDAALEDEIDETSTPEVHSPVDAPVHYFKGESVNISTTAEETQRASLKRKKRLSTQTSTESNDSLMHVTDHFTKPAMTPALSPASIGLPLAVFSKGVLCHPYLCLQNYDILNDVNVRGFVVGATNMLFKQKKHLLDVIVELGDVALEIHDSSLRRQLSLSTADLRFVDYLVSKTAPNTDSNNLYLESTGWEGGDEWIRAQFSSYLTAMLATVQRGDERALEDYNPHFVAAWKTTHNHKVWRSSNPLGLDGVMPIHPFHGSIAMSDMRLKFSHSMQNTERGKKINAAVSTTGRAVGGAISSAKSVVSSWFRELSKEWNEEYSEDDE